MTAVDLNAEMPIAPRAEPKRDRSGRYLLPPPAGEKSKWKSGVTPYTRTTTIAKELDNDYPIQRWRQRKVARGVAMKEDLYALANSHQDPDKGDRAVFEKIIDDAFEAAGGNAKSNQGTALHRYIELLQVGQLAMSDVPPRWRPQCERYFATLAAHEVKVDVDNVERIYIDDKNGVAGTGDLRALWPGRPTYSITDLKTGSTVDYSDLSISMQLAGYQGHTDTYDVLKNKRLGPIELDSEWGYVIHLPQDGDTCTIYRYDLSIGRTGYQAALKKRALQKADDIRELVRPPGATVSFYDQISQRIWFLISKGLELILDGLWPATVPKPFPIDPTREQWATMDAFLAPFEAAVEAPFPSPVAP